jgi:cytochrome-b5 reductase
MLQVAEEVIRNSSDTTQVSLIYANVSPKDILLRKRLDALVKEHSNFHVFYVVDKAPMGGLGWNGGVGYITDKMVSKNLPPPGDDSLVLVCCPAGP